MTDVHTSILELRGGTDAAMAPPVSYVDQILLPMLERLQGVKASIDLQRRGFFPKVVMLLHSYLPAVQTCGTTRLAPVLTVIHGHNWFICGCTHRNCTPAVNS